MPVGFDVELDLGDIPAKIDLMIQRIETAKVAQMPGEFVEWQSDDMKRSFPSIDIGTGPDVDDTWAATTIWPRSRLSMMKDMQRRQGKPVRRRQQSSANPILRYELFGKLIARMQNLLGEIRWR